MKKKDKLPDFIHIDRNNLHEEAQRQPALAMKWAVKVADAEDAVSELESELELTVAQLDKLVRKDPKKYGVKLFKGEPREGAIRNAIVLQVQYQEASKALRKAKHRYNIYKAASDALSFQKKPMIELEEKLDARGYFAVPSEIRVERERD